MAAKLSLQKSSMLNTRWILGQIMDKIDYEDMKYENEEEDASLDQDIEQ